MVNVDLCAHKAFLDLQNIRSEQGSLVSVLEMFMFGQLISRPELELFMKSGYVGVFRVSDLRTVIFRFMTG